MMINFVFLILYERIVICLNIYTVYLITYRYITSLALTIKEIIILQLKNNFTK